MALTETENYFLKCERKWALTEPKNRFLEINIVGASSNSEIILQI